MKIRNFILLALFALCTPALAQGVRQSGNVTAGHGVRWTTNGVIDDAGTAAEGKLTSIGVTASGSGICQNSDVITAAGYQRICIGVTTAGGGVLSVQNFGTASALPLTFNVNGSAVTLPSAGGAFVTTSLPATNAAAACFSGTGGAIAACAGLPASVLVAGPGLSYSAPNLTINIASLSADTSPDATNDYLMMRRASDGAIVKINPTTIAATNTSGVGSIAGLSGTVGAGYGIAAGGGNALIVDPTAVRVKQTGTIELFVRTDGNDSNTCLGNAAGTACLTIQGAWNKLQNNYDLAGNTCQVSVADGTYTTTFTPTQMPVGAANGICLIIGNTSTPANVVLNVTGGNAIQCGSSLGSSANLFIDGFELRTTTSGNALEVNSNCTVRVGSHMRFGATAGIHIYGHTGGRVVETTPGYAIVGSATYHLFAIDNAAFIIHGVTITCSGAPDLTFAYAGQGGTLLVNDLTFSGCGSLTGGRFYADVGGNIVTNSTSPTYFPGDGIGTIVAGGVIDTFFKDNTAYTPGAIPTGGAFGVAPTTAGTSSRRGNLFYLFASITITNNGTATGSLVTTSPFTLAKNCYMSGRDGLTGKQLNVQGVSGGTTITVQFYDNTSPLALNAVLEFDGWCVTTTAN